MSPRIPAGKLSFHVREEGTGTPLLFVHGFPLDHTMWNAQISTLSAKYRVIAPDLPGFGNSQVVDGTLTMAEMADGLADLLDALNISQKVTFCGLSMGGYVAWDFFRRHRQRVRSLILCDTRAAPDTTDAAQARRTLAEEVLSTGSEMLVERMLPRLVSQSTIDGRPDVVDSLKQMISSASPQGVAAALRGMAERADSRPLLDEIDVPALLICGRDDELSPPEEMRGMAESIATSRFTVIQDAGHMAPMEQSDEVNAVIAEFLPLE